MRKIFILSISSYLLLYACRSGKSNESTDSTSTSTRDTAKKNYLPVEDYLIAEIATVDSFPYKLMRFRISQGKTDSGIITTAEFNRIAAEFLLPDLDSSRFEKNFEENSFVDRTTNLVSFTYSTKDTGNGLKRVDVLLSPGTGTNKLHSIYMEAISENADSTRISKLSWKAGRNFSILHLVKPRNGPETASQTVVVWDSRD